MCWMTCGFGFGNWMGYSSSRAEVESDGFEADNYVVFADMIR